MKHLWFGAGLLALLLAVSLWLGGGPEDRHQSAVKDLEKASDAALDGDWDLAEALYIRAEKHWNKYRNLSAVLTHHNLIDQIDIGFSMLADYSRCRDTAPFAATCSQIALQLRSLPQSHAFSWQNLL